MSSSVVLLYVYHTTEDALPNNKESRLSGRLLGHNIPLPHALSDQRYAQHAFDDLGGLADGVQRQDGKGGALHQEEARGTITTQLKAASNGKVMTVEPPERRI